MAVLRSVFLLMATVLVIVFSSTINAQTNKCYPTPLMCRKMSNQSITPNLLGQDNRTSAETVYSKWNVLMRYNCSPDLMRFLCQVYFPPCHTIPPIVFPPCQEFCEKVRSECAHWIRQFKFQWPKQLDCSRFSKHSKDADTCAWPRPKSTTTTTTTSRPWRRRTTTTTTTTPRPWQRWTTTTAPMGFYCPAWQMSKARVQLMKIIDVSGWRYPCKMELKERLQTDSGAGSLSIDGRLRRIDRLLGSMSAQMRILTANNKVRRTMSSIRRLLRNF